MNDKSAFEHNTQIMPAWYQEIVKQNARAAILLSFKEAGEGLMLTAPNLSREDVIQFLRETLTHIEGGKQMIILPN
jgi:hypothetical protein